MEGESENLLGFPNENCKWYFALGADNEIRWIGLDRSNRLRLKLGF
jgi:hypothetical protein